jgi:hypothetical protein
VVIATMDPYGNEAADRMALAVCRRFTGFAMEFMPRITRAQVMDVLSSQANLAGYQAVIDAAVEFDRALPMMMTAAGTVPAAKAFVMGAGVAGLQAIATAKAARRRGDGDRRAPGRRRSRSNRSVPSSSPSRTKEFKAGRDRRRLCQGNVQGIPGEAGRAGGRATSPSRTSSSRRR